MFEFDTGATIRLGDAFELIKQVPDQSVDALISDPPYMIGNYSSGNIKFSNRKDMNNDIAGWDQGDLDPTALAHEFKRVLKPTGNLFIFTGSNLFGKWHALLDPIFDTFQYMAWHKTNPTPSVRKSSFLNSLELIVCCWNKGHTWNFFKQNEMHNFIETPVCAGKERYKHPTQKPLKVMDHIMVRATNPGDLVLDPFMGTASTGASALRLGRRFLGFELDPAYYAICHSRLTTERMGQPPDGDPVPDLTPPAPPDTDPSTAPTPVPPSPEAPDAAQP
jgi:site-specific DNA-methyltransferase (adenine-specific)/modification methylase